MKNKNLKKIKYVSGNPQNAGFCTIYPLTIFSETVARCFVYALSMIVPSPGLSTLSKIGGRGSVGHQGPPEAVG
jgi:hypothetical protein